MSRSHGWSWTGGVVSVMAMGPGRAWRDYGCLPLLELSAGVRSDDGYSRQRLLVVVFVALLGFSVWMTVELPLSRRKHRDAGEESA